MRTNVEIYTEALVKMIQVSDEYLAFEEVKKKIEGKPDIKKKIDKYRMDNYVLQNFNETTDLYEKTEKFYEESAELREIPLVEEYLSCELAVCRMLQKIFSTVVDAVDLQIEEIAGNLPVRGEK